MVYIIHLFDLSYQDLIKCYFIEVHMLSRLVNAYFK